MNIHEFYISLIRVFNAFFLNRTRVQRIGNTHETRFRLTRAVV